MVGAGAILAEGFALLRRRPLAILVWAAAYFVGSIVLGIVVSLMFGGGLMAMMRPEQPPAFASPIGFLLAFPVLYLGMFLLLCIVMNAAFRAVLRPGDTAFASLRLGGDELRALGLMLMFLVVGGAAYFIVVLMLVFLGSAVGLASGGDPRVQGPVGILLMLALLCGFVWLWVRLSLAFPLTLYRRRITVDAAWALSKGRFWPLFIAYLAVWALFMAAALALLLPMLASLWSSHAASASIYAGDPMQFQMERQAAFFAALPHGAWFFFWSIALLLVSVFGYALMFGTQAAAAKLLLIESGEFDDGAATTLDVDPFGGEPSPSPHRTDY
jgi:hypothetical protein